MLTLAAYRFEAPYSKENDSWGPAMSVIESWLAEKGVSDVKNSSGEFKSLTASRTGTYKRERFSSETGELAEVTLREPTSDGDTFITYVSMVAAKEKLVIFTTLSAANAGDLVAPIRTYLRCPSVVKDLLASRDDWNFGGSQVPSPYPISLSGKKAASSLVGYLSNVDRSLPVTVVSELEGEPIWEELPEKLAVDLAGLSSVIRIENEASWEISELLGKKKSCYLGAVRVYWPIKAAGEELYTNLWTAEKLLSRNSDGKGISRFTTMLRRRLMSVAALAVDAPKSIRKIKNEVSRESLEKLQDKAESNSEELELAQIFIEENETLKEQLDNAQKEIARQAARAETAEHTVELLKTGDSDDEESEESEEAGEDVKIEPGEIRHYKKTHSTPTYDVLVRIKDCGHNSWQSADKADKAKKGIERLEGRSDWNRVFHCGKCGGGGVWQVKW